MNSRKLNGFTLIEILAVIAISVILISIVVATMGRARDRAHLVHCVSNMREVHAAFSLYAIDNNSEYPRAQTFAPEGSGGGMWDYEGGFWFNAIGEYLDGGRRFRPIPWSNPSPQNIPFACSSVDEGKHGWGGVGIDIGINGYLFPAGSPSAPRVQVMDIKNPSQAMLVADAETASGHGAWLIHDPSPVGPNKIAFRHGGKANILFLDGRVSQVTPEDIGNSDFVRKLRGQ